MARIKNLPAPRNRANVYCLSEITDERGRKTGGAQLRPETGVLVLTNATK